MKTSSAIFGWVMEVEIFPWYQQRWRQQRKTKLLLTDLCGIIYKSFASPSCITRTFITWHMLRPHACVPAHEWRFAIGLETEERQQKRSQMRMQMGEKIQVWHYYLIFLLVSNVDIGENLMHCEGTSWASELEEYRLYTSTLKTMKTP